MTGKSAIERGSCQPFQKCFYLGCSLLGIKAFWVSLGLWLQYPKWPLEEKCTTGILPVQYPVFIIHYIHVLDSVLLQQCLPLLNLGFVKVHPALNKELSAGVYLFKNAVLRHFTLWNLMTENVSLVHLQILSFSLSNTRGCTHTRL